MWTQTMAWHQVPLKQLGKDEKIGVQSPTLINQKNVKATECFMVNEGEKVKFSIDLF